MRIARMMTTTRIVLVGFLLLVAAGGLGAQRSPADDAAIRALYSEFFEAFRQAGAQGASGYLRQSGSIEEETLRELEREARVALEGNPVVGRPDSWVVVREAEIAGADRYRVVYALTHHDGRPVPWRLRLYKKVTGVWVFTDVDWEVDFVEDLLRMSPLEFAAYRRLLQRSPD